MSIPFDPKNHDQPTMISRILLKGSTSIFTSREKKCATGFIGFCRKVIHWFTHPSERVTRVSKVYNKMIRECNPDTQPIRSLANLYANGKYINTHVVTKHNRSWIITILFWNRASLVDPAKLLTIETALKERLDRRSFALTTELAKPNRNLSEIVRHVQEGWKLLDETQAVSEIQGDALNINRNALELTLRKLSTQLEEELRERAKVIGLKDEAEPQDLDLLEQVDMLPDAIKLAPGFIPIYSLVKASKEVSTTYWMILDKVNMQLPVGPLEFCTWMGTDERKFIPQEGIETLCNAYKIYLDGTLAKVADGDVTTRNDRVDIQRSISLILNKMSAKRHYNLDDLYHYKSAIEDIKVSLKALDGTDPEVAKVNHQFENTLGLVYNFLFIKDELDHKIEKLNNELQSRVSQNGQLWPYYSDYAQTLAKLQQMLGASHPFLQTYIEVGEDLRHFHECMLIFNQLKKISNAAALNSAMADEIASHLLQIDAYMPRVVKFAPHLAHLLLDFDQILKKNVQNNQLGAFVKLTRDALNTLSMCSRALMNLNKSERQSLSFFNPLLHPHFEGKSVCRHILDVTAPQKVIRGMRKDFLKTFPSCVIEEVILLEKCSLMWEGDEQVHDFTDSELSKLTALSARQDLPKLLATQLQLLLKMAKIQLRPKMTDPIMSDELTDPVALSTSPYKYYNQNNLMGWLNVEKKDPFTRARVTLKNIKPKPEVTKLFKEWESIEKTLHGQ